MALIGFGIILIILSFLLGYTFRNYRLMEEPRDYTFTRIIGGRRTGKTTMAVEWAREKDCIVVVPIASIARWLGKLHPDLTIMSAIKAVDATKGDIRDIVIDDFDHCLQIEARTIDLLPRTQLITMALKPVEKEERENVL